MQLVGLPVTPFALPQCITCPTAARGPCLLNPIYWMEQGTGLTLKMKDSLLLHHIASLGDFQVQSVDTAKRGNGITTESM